MECVPSLKGPLGTEVVRRGEAASIQEAFDLILEMPKGQYFLEGPDFPATSDGFEQQTRMMKLSEKAFQASFGLK